MSKKFIAYLDILGFKDLVEKNPHEELCFLYENFVTQLYNAIALVEPVVINGREEIVFDHPKITLNSLMISDGIIIWTDDNTIESFIKIALAVRGILHILFKRGLPLRGAIVEGDIKKIDKGLLNPTDNSPTTLVGLGLVKAYETEAKQDWSGCIVDESCIKTYKEYHSQNHHISGFADFEKSVNQLFIEYEIPMKSGELKKEYAINWVSFSGTCQINGAMIRPMFQQHNKDCKKWDVERKIKNTIDFVEHVRKNQSSYTDPMHQVYPELEWHSRCDRSVF